MNYYRPTDLSETLDLLSRTDEQVVPLAGGTALLAQPGPPVQAVVDLQELGLDSIEVLNGLLHLGATATLEAVATSPDVKSFARGEIAEAARRSASSVLRQQGTVAGTILAGGSTDLAIVLAALQAYAVLEPNTRHVSLEDLWANPTAHLAHSLITEIAVPATSSEAQLSYQRVSRTPSDRLIVGVAVVMEGDAMRVAIGGGTPQPAIMYQFKESESLSVGSIRFASDVHASAEYRHEMATVLLRRAMGAGG
jgi:CO/xanthine dehydrogenase FAD-binding subunit